jgi:hypothetical protein
MFLATNVGNPIVGNKPNKSYIVWMRNVEEAAETDTPSTNLTVNHRQRRIKSFDGGAEIPPVRIVSDKREISMKS